MLHPLPVLHYCTTSPNSSEQNQTWSSSELAAHLDLFPFVLKMEIRVQLLKF